MEALKGHDGAGRGKSARAAIFADEAPFTPSSLTRQPEILEALDDAILNIEDLEHSGRIGKRNLASNLHLAWLAYRVNRPDLQPRAMGELEDGILK